jgi:hypothetical protein
MSVEIILVWQRREERASSRTSSGSDVPESGGYKEAKRNDHVDVEKVENHLKAVGIQLKELEACRSMKIASHMSELRPQPRHRQIHNGVQAH